MKRITVFPIKDHILRDTNGNIVPEGGKSVPLNTYWSRRIKAGDCIIKEEKEKTDSPDVKSAPSGSSKNSESTKKTN